MFRDVPESSGMFHVLGFIVGRNVHPLTSSDESMNAFYAYKIRINIYIV